VWCVYGGVCVVRRCVHGVYGMVVCVCVCVWWCVYSGVCGYMSVRRDVCEQPRSVRPRGGLVWRPIKSRLSHTSSGRLLVSTKPNDSVLPVGISKGLVQYSA